MERTISQVKAAARRNCPLFFVGPTGAGKTTLAYKAHEWSGRRGGFVSLNCAALPEGLAEAELFGSASGAFTDAKRAKSGYFEQASEGTLFLDEVGDLSPTNQARLLKAVEEGAIVRVGETTPRPTSCRIIAATSRPDLLRPDLAYRLGGVVVEVPGLAARRSEILPLANRFAAEALAHLSPDAPTFLLDADWPGNVRELRNVITAAAVLAEADGRNVITAADLAQAQDTASRLFSSSPAPSTSPTTPASPIPAWPPSAASSLLPPVTVRSPRWLSAWRLSHTHKLFTREDYEAAAGAPRSTAGRDLREMISFGILRRLPPRHYAWIGGDPSV